MENSNPTINVLSEQLRALQVLKQHKKKLDDALADTKSEIEAAKADIIGMMMDSAEQMGLADASAFTIVVDGRKYGVAIKPFYSIKAGDREKAFAALREYGLGDLIVEKVDDRSLTKRLCEMEDEIDEEFLQSLHVGAYEKTDIFDRKA